MSDRNVFLAKGLVASAFGAASGWFLAQALTRDAERGRTLTMEQYIADFDRYKARLESQPLSTIGTIVAMVVLCVGIFGLCELLAALVARLLGGSRDAQRQ